MSVLTSTGAASLIAASEELIGPLSDAVRPTPLPWGEAATFDTGAPTRYPVLLIRLLVDLGDESLTAAAVVNGVNAPSMTFAPWSEHGSSLLMCVPATDPGGVAARVTGTVSATRTATDGTTSGLAAAAVTDLFTVDLVEGVLGRLTLVLLSEKPRLRRQARELRAARVLDHARLGTLDRIGADLGVPRLRDEITWDAATKQVSTQPLPGGEADHDFRARLRVLRGMRLPSPVWIDARTNGAGAPSDPGAGWLADVGFGARLGVDETANPLLVAFRIVDPTRGEGRTQLLEAIRRVHLVWPAGSPGDAIHNARMVSPSAAPRTAKSRAALTALSLPTGQPVAPSVAGALARLLDLQTQLGVQVYAHAVSGQHDDGGSRFELGLGVALQAPAAATVDQAATAAKAATAAGTLDAGLQPRGSADDPIASWLLAAVGLRTAHVLADGTVYASPMSAGGLVVDVTPGPGGPSPLTLTARLEGPDTSHDGPIAQIVSALLPDGISPLADAAATALVAGMKPTAPNAGVDGALAALDLPRVTNVVDVQQRLAKVDARDYIVVDLGPAMTAAVVADHAKLGDLIEVAARGGASSALPFLTAAGTIALVLGVVDLPMAGNNLSSRHTVAYRWQVHGLVDRTVRLNPAIGPSTTLTVPGQGVSVVACVAYVRTGGNDPYEWRPALPDDAVLTLRQYEHLMNVVELATPVGVRADTWEIRRRHVSVDGSATPTPLNPRAARTYHRYRPLHP